MSHSTSLAHRQSPAVERKRSWSLMLLSSAIGAAVSLGTVFAIAALMDPGAIRFIAGTTAAGILWGITTQVTNSLIGSETVAVVLQSSPIQQSYRKTIEQHLGAVLGDAITSIRTNSPFELQNSVYFDVCDGYRFEDKDKHMFFWYFVKVVPEPGTPPRSLDESLPPLDLPTYDPSSIHTMEVHKATARGVYTSLRQGTLLGLTSGASASLMSLLLGTAGIVLGVVLATMLVSRLAPPKSPEKAALVTEFASELRCHLDRLIRCARDNNIGLEADVCVSSTAGITRTWAGRSRVDVKPMARVYRRLSGRVVWAGEMTEGDMRTGKQRKSIADGNDK
ncbi:hypothetical protein J3F83DRAFT_770585 [Trichoderma novae-zelandiae]